MAPVDTRQGIVEGILDALEAVLQREPSATEQREESTHVEVPPAASPAAPTREKSKRNGSGAPAHPSLAPDRGRRSRRARPWGIGGIGLGVALEPLPAPLDLAIGPRLDVALGAGRVAAVASEALRLGLGAEANAQLLDAQVGVAWGAPFASGGNWGALALVGLQWLALSARDQTLRTSTVALGLRSGMEVGPANLWFGLDGVIRVSPQRSEPRTPIALEPFSLVLLVGGFLLAE